MNLGNPASPFPTDTQFVDNALLLATVPDISNPYFLSSAICHATTHTTKRLTIVLFSRYFNSTSNYGNTSLPPASHTGSWDSVQRLLTFTYVQATKIAQDMNKVLMDVDVLLKGLDEDFPASLGPEIELIFRVSGDSIPVPLPETIAFLRTSYIQVGDHQSTPETVSASPPSSTPSTYPVVALGGTFDHLHAGHKILLSMGAWITNQKLIVGVTDDTLLQNKSNKHILEPLSRRIARVRGFLTLFKHSVTYEIVPITDVYGPTGWDPNIQALVVSKETLGGADAVAKHRAIKNLPSLQPFLIDVISATDASLDHEDATWLREHKLSSTFIRQWIADQQDKDKAQEVGGTS